MFLSCSTLNIYSVSQVATLIQTNSGHDIQYLLTWSINWTHSLYFIISYILSLLMLFSIILYVHLQEGVYISLCHWGGHREISCKEISQLSFCRFSVTRPIFVLMTVMIQPKPFCASYFSTLQNNKYTAQLIWPSKDCFLCECEPVWWGLWWDNTESIWALKYVCSLNLCFYFINVLSLEDESYRMKVEPDVAKLNYR